MAVLVQFAGLGPEALAFVEWAIAGGIEFQVIPILAATDYAAIRKLLLTPETASASAVGQILLVRQCPVLRHPPDLLQRRTQRLLSALIFLPRGAPNQVQKKIQAPPRKLFLAFDVARPTCPPLSASLLFLPFLRASPFLPSGADLAYAATSRTVWRYWRCTYFTYGSPDRPTLSLRDVRLVPTPPLSGVALRARYAMSGTDLRYAPTRYPWLRILPSVCFPISLHSLPMCQVLTWRLL
eukprot:1285141-Rhodomonas_salina.1